MSRIETYSRLSQNLQKIKLEQKSQLSLNQSIKLEPIIISESA